MHDVSDGGLLVALAEMAMASGIGAVLEAPAGLAAHAFWFGEDQARYVRHRARHERDEVIGAAEGGARPAAPARRDRRRRARACRRAAATASRILSERFENWLPAYMAGAGVTLSAH